MRLLVFPCVHKRMLTRVSLSRTAIWALIWLLLDLVDCVLPSLFPNQNRRAKKMIWWYAVSALCKPGCSIYSAQTAQQMAKNTARVVTIPGRLGPLACTHRLNYPPLRCSCFC
jgi:hypothetical protein